jgi:hypothetical protein
MGCCKDPDIRCDIVPGQYICKNCCAIDEAETIIGNENECEALNYYKYQGFKMYIPYKHVYHLNEVLHRIQGVEKNRPTSFDNIKTKLNGDYSIENIYKNCNHKHLIYIYCVLNDLPFLIFPMGFKYEVTHAILNIASVCKKRMPSYIHIIKCVCEKNNWNDVLPYLYMKTCNKQITDFINKNL